ncbi:MAG TPA: glycosyltransferase family 4 protein [Burkholderiaceae bacterium]|jgi:spore coat protein SA
MSASIAIVVPELLPVPAVKGGAVEHWVDEASRRMAGTWGRVMVVSRPSGVAGDKAIRYVGIPWTWLERQLHRLKERVTWRNPLRYVAKLQNVFSYGRRVAVAVRDVDVVYLHNEPNILLFLKKRPGRKIVLHMHNDHLSLRLFRPFYRHALAKVDVVICVSDYIRRQAVAHFPEHAARFRVVLNATNADLFQPYGAEALRQLEGVVRLDADKRYLLYVGRLTSIKGVHVLIQACREVFRHHPEVRLVIAGSSFFEGAVRTDYERELIALAAPVSDAIAFTGYLPHEKLKYLYAAADLVVLPSVWQEPFGLVMLEAMASGTCVVSSAVGGIPEVLEDGHNGVLVRPDDAAALADAICKALAAPDAMQRMETAARQRVLENFTWERLVGELETVIGAIQ